METVILDRKQTAFRLRSDLIAKLKILAKKENRSLNNYVENVLMDAVSYVPNEETLKAMKEVEHSNDLEILDIDSFDEFVKSLD